jgi:PKD repeat protein
VICLFCCNITAQETEKLAPATQEPEQVLLSPCGNAANFSVNAFVTPPSCCAQFTAPNDGQYGSVSWDFGDGNSSYDPTSVYHCYSQSGNYPAKHTVILDDGTICTKTKNVTITNCTPCPDLLGISVSPTDEDPLLRDCSPTNFTSSPVSVNCSYRFAPIISGSSVGSSFSWELYLITLNPFSWSPECSVQNSPAFRILKHSNSVAQGLWYAIRVTMTRPDCPTQITSKFFQVTDYQCHFVTFLKSPTNNPAEVALLKKAMSNTQGVQIYPNPTDNFLQISNLKDSENYTFDIQNTLGQTVLTQKITTIDAKIDVSNLMTGVYISVLKSQGKIISTEKIYKQ